MKILVLDLYDQIKEIEMKVKSVSKIPFTKKEFESAFVNMINKSIIEMTSILAKEKKFSFKNDEDLVCEFDGDIYFLFKKNMPEIDKNVDITNTYENLEDLKAKAPELKHIEHILDTYKHEFNSRSGTQRRKFNFVAGLNGKSIFEYVNGEWIATDWVDGKNAYPVWIYELPETNNESSLLITLIKNRLEPNVSFTNSQMELFSLLGKFGKSLSIENESIKVDFNSIPKTVIDSLENDTYKSLLQSRGINNPDDMREISDYLLDSEKRRCDHLERYSDSFIDGTDQDAGLWDFWTDEEPEYGYSLSQELIAHNPKDDAKKNVNRVIAIDFGTSSTVVVRVDDNGNPIQMRMGGETGEYENPTLLQVISLENFLKDYYAKDGRPETKWDDLWVSHAVKDIFSEKGLKDDKISSILYQIKQWAANDKDNIVIKAINDDKIHPLPALSDLIGKEGEFNPIEIYAYFIGLHINNRKNGIYLDYYMSYPEKYDKKIRENIRRSFEKGLKKSIPESVFNGKDEKYELKVHMDVCEPVAYATCALKTFGFEPKANSPINYAIFDFGGGTSDFAYGLWKESTDKKNFQYFIEKKAIGGDKYLGGENLLNALAFEVFSDEENCKRMVQSGCRFPAGIPTQNIDSLPPGAYSNQQPAKKNLRDMSEEMRQFWENASETLGEYLEGSEKTYSVESLIEWANKLLTKISDDEDDVSEELHQLLDGLADGKEDPDNAAITLDRLEKRISPEKEEESDIYEFSLTLAAENKDSEGNRPYPQVKFAYSKRKIYDFFVKRITDGVDNFFSKLEEVFFKNKNFDNNEERVNIFLAGNSSKSPILRNVIEKKILLEEQSIGEKYKVKPKFKVYSPLGNDERVYKEMAEVITEQDIPEVIKRKKLENIEKYRNSDQKPNGKTGVAFGLVDLASQHVKIEDSEQKKGDTFNFYLGLEKSEYGMVFFDVINFAGSSQRGIPEIGVWYKIQKANRDKTSYTIKFTSDSKCLKEYEMEAKEAPYRNMVFKSVQENDYIWIVARDSSTIQFVLAEDVSDEELETSEKGPEKQFNNKSDEEKMDLTLNFD